MLPNEIDQGLTCPACGVGMTVTGEDVWCEQRGKCGFAGYHRLREVFAVWDAIAAARKPTVPRIEFHDGKWVLTLPGDGVPLSQATDIIESAAKAVGEVTP